MKLRLIFITDNRNHLGIRNGDINIIKVTELSIADRYSTGSQLSKKELNDAFTVSELKKKEDLKLIEESNEEKIESIPKKDKISLEEIDDRLMTIDDFLD